MSKQIKLNQRIVKRFNKFLNELVEEGEDIGEVIYAMNLFAVEATMDAFTHEQTVKHFGSLIELRRRKLAGELDVEGSA